MINFKWVDIKGLPSRSYTCGYCGNHLASERGWVGQDTSTGDNAFVYVCHFCLSPTFFDLDDYQTPGATFGDSVNDIPDEAIKYLYEEARKTTSVGAYTSTVLACRKLLMHIAVSKGAPVGQNFVAYVQYLTENHYVPPDAKDWVNHIREKGNEANHEIVVMSKDDAEELLSFIAMLLKVIYEFPSAIKRKMSAS